MLRGFVWPLEAFLITAVIYSLPQVRSGVRTVFRGERIIVSTHVHGGFVQRFRVLSLVLKNPASAYVDARNIMLSSRPAERRAARGGNPWGTSSTSFLLIYRINTLGS